ncbi:N-acetyl-gamma-glutamyl-phosphate reductase [Metallumcola ferriviriculae]|uniref:N-acetyl-gamma-glutamyl-phosphate reductase n=1 Tax=Metallumcola ferriviriculae TaxID=3039180 RepID=A0AAU0UH30_9FIRM|nr:N-acetyl-gamma-glutamyl-phosphate reductase [Desulfitibacteraceae bacterium MK1]
MKVGIVGATGYTGVQLVQILSRHENAEISFVTSQSYAGRQLAEVYPHLAGLDLVLTEYSPALLQRCDCLFIALPHGLSGPVVADAREQGVKVIDLGADFRLDDAGTYQQWYGSEHSHPQWLRQGVYGLPEINRAKIGNAQLVANPGCYPTTVLLALAPLADKGLVNPGSIIIDAKSGVSGAGRKVSLTTHYSEVNDSITAYGVASHRHTPEIEQELGKFFNAEVKVSFTPHLVPMTRGMLSTIYASLSKTVNEDELRAIYQDYYQGEPFVQLLSPGQWPKTKYCYGSNRCFLNLTVDQRTGRLILVSCIDNLVKGASGQAVQNFNILAGLPEDTGLAGMGMMP